MTQKKRKKGKELKTPSGGEGQSLRDYDPATINPNTEQFEPTEACPVPRHARQAGVS